MQMHVCLCKSIHFIWGYLQADAPHCRLLTSFHVTNCNLGPSNFSFVRHQCFIKLKPSIWFISPSVIVANTCQWVESARKDESAEGFEQLAYGGAGWGCMTAANCARVHLQSHLHQQIPCFPQTLQSA